MARKNLIEQMRKTTAAEEHALEARFAKADSVLLRGAGAAPVNPVVPAPEPAVAVIPAAPQESYGRDAAVAAPIPVEAASTVVSGTEYGVREGFSLLTVERQWLHDAVRSTRMTGLTDTTRSQVIRAGIAYLQTLTPTQLVKAVHGVQRLRVGRRPGTKG